ncbi:hypothetical protein TNCV_2648721 [Trichonephila clavipes]|nr:hypothetical protein TNCV_2648721 [Trichonephila clavipes]
MLPMLGKKAVLEWCMKEGLIGPSYVCPKCGKSIELKKERLDTLREDCGIIRKQASTDGGVLWKVVCVDVVQVRRKDRSLRDPREARSRVRV